MKRLTSVIFWIILSLIGAASIGYIALNNGEKISALWFVTAAVCFFMISYRFYSKWLITKVFVTDNNRPTPAFTMEDGKDYVPTNKWIVFGHHFAAIAGAGPLAGPVLAAQFGYLPGTLWILIGATLGGAVHDAIILFASIRRNGKSLGQMVKEEVSSFAGYISMISITSILVILIAVLSLIVVKALAHSSWGLFTIAMTIPIALLMGFYMRFLRPHKVLEVSIIGLILLLLSVWGGHYVFISPTWSKFFTLSGENLAWATIFYGLAASILPVWMLLAPRDYLSSFMKVGTVILLMIAVIFVAPPIQMPKFTQFIDGNGFVVAGKLFPFVFITIACSAISGFHSLISSGTSPKMVMSESSVRTVGYAAMLTEMVVGLMALVAACALEPGQYFAINMKGEPAAIVQKITNAGFTVTEEDMKKLAESVSESSMYDRSGGAPTFAVGMALMFAQVIGGPSMMSLWYHFAIMFEVLFILTTIDAGTRVGRFILQDLLGHIWKPLGNTGTYFSTILSSVVFVSAWGWFLYQGVTDPEGGTKALWPIFGIANQLLAVIALSLGTTIIIRSGKAKYMLVTLIPMIFLMAVTMTAGWQKIFYPDAGGFVPAIEGLNKKIAATADPAVIAQLSTQIFYNKVDIAITAVYMVLVCIIVAANLWLWFQLLTGRKKLELHESC